VRALASSEGAEIAEAALVLPLVFMFLLGIVWFGRAFNIYSTITQAAQQGAQAAARPRCATCPAGGGWNGTSFPDNTAVENSVLAVMAASSVDKMQILAYTPPGLQSCPAPVMACPTTGNNITICRSVVLNPASPPEQWQCGVIVSFQYRFQFINVPLTSLGTPILLKAEAHSRMEN
jgi:hypothetical protein